MPYVVIVVVALTTFPVLWLGGRNVHRWDNGRDPEVFRDVTGRATVLALRAGLLLLMLALAAVAIIGSIAAILGDAPVPGGCLLAAVIAVLLAALVYQVFGRRVPGRVTRSH